MQSLQACKPYIFDEEFSQVVNAMNLAVIIGALTIRPYRRRRGMPSPAHLRHAVATRKVYYDLGPQTVYAAPLEVMQRPVTLLFRWL